MALYDAGRDPQAQPGAVQAFGGVKGLKDALEDVCAHAVAGIGDSDADAGPPGWKPTLWCGDTVMGANDETSSVAHGVNGVGDEVVEDLADVIFKAEDARCRAIACLHADAGVAETAGVKADDRPEEIFCGDRSGCDGLAMKAEGLRGDLRDA